MNPLRLERLKRLWRYPAFSFAVILIFIFLAFFGESLAPYPPNETRLSQKLLPPFWQEGGSMVHPMGTDMLGRDMLSRIMAGARVSFIVAVLALTVGGLAGSALGIIAGYYGGKVDAFLMRAADATLAFPIILLAMLLVIILGPSIQNVVVSLGITLWARYAVVIRGEVLSLKSRDFIALARVAGASNLRIMFLHLFLNIRNTLIVMLTLQVGWVIIVEASLSFIGAGIPGPSPVWGSMIAGGREYISLAWWIPFFPGFCVAAVCLSFNMAGDWLRETLDPKIRQIS